MIAVILVRGEQPNVLGVAITTANTRKALGALHSTPGNACEIQIVSIVEGSYCYVNCPEAWIYN